MKMVTNAKIKNQKKGKKSRSLSRTIIVYQNTVVQRHDYLIMNTKQYYQRYCTTNDQHKASISDDLLQRFNIKEYENQMMNI